MLNKLKQTSVFFLILMATILIGTVFLFFCKIGISPFHLPVFFAISSLFYCILYRQDTNKDKILVILLSFTILFFTTLVATVTFDRSSDGNTYHKDAIGVLKEGFNPVYESSADFIKKRTDESKKLKNYSIWTDHYAKANWIIAANFYSLTNNIESGKAMNFITLYLVFGFLAFSLSQYLTKYKAVILAFLVVFNPITASQLFTYYNDQLVCLYLFLAIAFLIQLDHNIHDKKNWLYYGLTFILLANMKFNGLGYLLVFSFFFVCRYLYKSYRQQIFLKTFQKLCCYFIPLFVISLLIVGYPTYVKNTIDHHNPFFPLYDDKGEDIITQQQPQKFLKMNHLEKLFYATFSRANNLRKNDKTELKIPFTISKDEIIPAMSNDLRISGFGLLYSGLLICSLLILIIYYPLYKQNSWILYTLFITCGLLIFMSESWWARYTPHFYLFLLLSLYILFRYGKHPFTKKIYVAIILVNALIPFCGNTYYTITNSIQIRKTLCQLSGKKIKVQINGMNGIVYNLKDYHIKYSFTKSNQKNELYYHYLTYQEYKDE